MKTFLTMIFAVASLLPSDLLNLRFNPAGEWNGVYSNSEANGELSVRVGNANGAWSVAVKATSQYVANPQFMPASNVRVAGDTVEFSLTWGTPVRWVGIVRGDSLTGSMSADHWSGSWRTKREPR